MRVCKQSTTRNVDVFMTDSADHITGKAGLTLTVTASKDGGAFSSISPTVTDLGSGWYKLELTTSHTDTLGDLALHVTATGADPADTLMQVVAYDFTDAVRLGLSAVPNANPGASGGVFISGTNTGTVTITDGLVVNRSTANGDAVTFTGNDYGTGLVVTGGVNGSGALITAGASAANGKGMVLGGRGTGQGLSVSGGVNDGAAVAFNGGGSSGIGLDIFSSTGVGLRVSSLVATSGITADIDGTLTTVTNLTNLPTAPTDWVTAAAVSAGAVSKIQSGLSTYNGSDTAGTTTLLSRVTAARGGYLDNLNVGGNVASQADINALNESASRTLILQTVPAYERPESGTTLYTVEARTFSKDTGNPVNADSTPTLTATGNISGNLSANLSAATNPATGVYQWTYTVAAAATLEQITMGVSATLSAVTYTMNAYTQTADTVAATFTSTDQANLTAIFNKLPVNNIADQTLLTASIGTPMQAYTQPTGFLSATFPATVASPTNITAGTLTTVGTVTNPVTVGTNNDKTGYTVSGTTTTLDALQTALNSSHGAGSWATATGFAEPGDAMTLTAAYDAAKTALPAATYATGNAAVLTAVGVVNTNVGSLSTDLTWVKNYIGGDRVIDISQTPWEEVVYVAGTATELTRKILRDVDGDGITNVETVIGSAKET